MNDFLAGMNQANASFGVACGEEFQVLRVGMVGTYQAVNIDDVVASNAVAPGGKKAENTVNLFINRAVAAAGQIRKDTVLSVRGETVRIISLSDESDDTLLAACGPAGIRL